MYNGVNSSPPFSIARTMCEKYIAYPVTTWKDLFVKIANQIADYDLDNEDTPEAKQKKLDSEFNQKLKLSKSLEAAQDTNGMKIKFRSPENLKKLTFDLFEIDLEVLYSVNPFLGNSFQSLVYVKPTYSWTEEVSRKKNIHFQNFNFFLETETQDKEMFEKKFSIPEKYSSTSAIIKVRGDSLTKIFIFSHNELTLKINKLSGYIKVTSSTTQKSLPQTYIKCFVKMKDGKVNFFKDGFTDMRGCFEYCNFEGVDTSNMSRFSVYVDNENLGSLVQEIEIPNNAGQKKKRVKITSDRWIQKHQVAQQAYGSLMNRAKNRKMAFKGGKKKSKY